MRIVSRAESRSLRLASCCRVLVVKGGTGLRSVGFSSTAATRHGAFCTACWRARASASLSSRALVPALRAPVVSSKSPPPAIRSPFTWLSFASKLWPACTNLALRSQ